jgi:hypothetical protein
MMRFPVRILFFAVALFALTLCAGTLLQAQNNASQAPNGVYIAVDPLAGVRYDNRFDVSLAAAYDHMKAGPTLLQGSNLGGLDLSGSMWLSRHLAVEGSVRGYAGTSGAGVNAANSAGGNIQGPFVAEYFATAGPEWLGPHNKHGALIAHLLVGGVYGDFERDLGHPTATNPNPAQAVDFYNTQFAPAAIIGGHMDLNRTGNWVLRITPDAVLTHYSINYPPKTSQFDVNFAISVGIQYKFSKKR